LVPVSGMRIERARENVLTVTATSQELSALVAAARMSFEAMRSAPEPPPAAVIGALERVLSDFDRARDRLGEEGGQEG
jgi:CRISPR-associated Cas5-like protein